MLAVASREAQAVWKWRTCRRGMSTLLEVRSGAGERRFQTALARSNELGATTDLRDGKVSKPIRAALFSELSEPMTGTTVRAKRRHDVHEPTVPVSLASIGVERKVTPIG